VSAITLSPHILITITRIPRIPRPGCGPANGRSNVGCGTGIVARAAADRHQAIRVVGVDCDPVYLAVARRAADGRPVEWCTADASSMPFANASFDVVLCQQALQFFEDRVACLKEMRRVLVHGGRLLASVWSSIERSPGFAALAAALTRRVNLDAGAVLTRRPFSLPDAGELAALASLGGFRNVSVTARERPARFPSVEAFVRRFLQAYPIDSVREEEEAAIAAVAADVRELLHEPSDAGGFSFPMQSNILTARR
jgi:SAM-dependent methyltransferase